MSPPAALRVTPSWGERSAERYASPPHRLLRDVTPREIVEHIGDFIWDEREGRLTLRFLVPRVWANEVSPDSLVPMSFTYREEEGECYSVPCITGMVTRRDGAGDYGVRRVRIEHGRLVVTFYRADLILTHLPMARGIAELTISHTTVRFFRGRRLAYGASAY